MTFHSEAPLNYKGCVIHILDEPGFFTLVSPGYKLSGRTWEELKRKIDEELQ